MSIGEYGRMCTYEPMRVGVHLSPALAIVLAILYQMRDAMFSQLPRLDVKLDVRDSKRI